MTISLRVNGPNGRQSIQVADSATVADLRQAISSGMQQLPASYDILYGFPPQKLEASLSTPLQDIPIVSGDSLRIQASELSGQLMKGEGEVMVPLSLTPTMQRKFPSQLLSKRIAKTKAGSSSSGASNSWGGIALSFFSSLGSAAPPSSSPTNTPSSSVSSSNGTLQSTSDVLGSAKVILLYFSAHWCGPCRQFTPQLASAYSSWKSSGLPIEVIFISSDRSPAQFAEYYASMPWAAIPFEDDSTRSRLGSEYSVRGIPRLVVLSRHGDILEDNAVGGNVGSMGQSWVARVK